jgi:hypothetical protein
MNERERQRDDVPGPGGPGVPGPEGGELDRHRERGERFFAAADAAISNALSTNHAQFLRDSEQEGGQ